MYINTHTRTHKKHTHTHTHRISLKSCVWACIHATNIFLNQINFVYIFVHTLFSMQECVLAH